MSIGRTRCAIAKNPENHIGKETSGEKEDIGEERFERFIGTARELSANEVEAGSSLSSEKLLSRRNHRSELIAVTPFQRLELLGEIHSPLSEETSGLFEPSIKRKNNLSEGQGVLLHKRPHCLNIGDLEFLR